MEDKNVQVAGARTGHRGEDLLVSWVSLFDPAIIRFVTSKDGHLLLLKNGHLYYSQHAASLALDTL